MTTFNDGPFLHQSVNSVLNQTFTDFELLLVDDGSGPETKRIIDTFDDPRLRKFSQANDGLSSARNRALAHAKGDYVCFLDGDDVRSPWSFAEAASLISEKNQPDLLFVMGVFSGERTRLEPFFDEANAKVFAQLAEQGKDVDLAFRKAWALALEPQCANKFISRELITRAALSFPNDHFFEDILFHSLAVAHARSIEVLPTSCHFTYFQRALRLQVTTSSKARRFDILGVAAITLQMFQRHAGFADGRQRGALLLSVARLLHWCESCLPLYHRDAFRSALRALLHEIDPLYFSFPDGTPDPKEDADRLIPYLQEVME